MDAGTQGRVLSYDQIRQREEFEDTQKIVNIADLKK